MSPDAAILLLWLTAHPEPAHSLTDVATALLDGVMWPDWEPWSPMAWLPAAVPWQLAGRFDVVGGHDGPWCAARYVYEPAGWCCG